MKFLEKLSRYGSKKDGQKTKALGRIAKGLGDKQRQDPPNPSSLEVRNGIRGSRVRLSASVAPRRY